MEACPQGKACGMAANCCNCQGLGTPADLSSIQLSRIAAPVEPPGAGSRVGATPSVLRGRVPPVAPATRLPGSRRAPLPTHSSKDNSENRVFFLLLFNTHTHTPTPQNNITFVFCSLSQNHQGTVASYKRRVPPPLLLDFHFCKLFQKPSRDMQHIWFCLRRKG